jgi:hypothetical protein
VVWEEPTAAEIAAEEEDIRRDRLAGLSRPAGRRPRTVAELRRKHGDYVILGSPTPVWQIRGRVARRIDADLESVRLAAAGGVTVGACDLPGDPMITHVSPDGSVFSHVPATIIVLDDTGTVRPVGQVASTDGVICQDRGRIWLLGFDHRRGDLEGPGPRELLLAEGRLTASLDMRLHHPVASWTGSWPTLSRSCCSRTRMG